MIKSVNEHFKRYGHKSMNLEEFINQLSGMPIAGGLLGISPSDQLKSSRDTQRRQDLARLQTLLDIYFAECKKFPQGLDKDASGKAGCTGLVPAYLANIPKDPKDQSNYYYKSDGKTYDLCAKLEVSNLPSTCPNPAYNYKVGSKSP